MPETTAPTSWTPPSWSLHGSAQIKRAWETLDGLYQADPWDARLQGARAAAEWSMGLSPITPVTNERKTPDRDTCRWESHRAAMREMGIGATDVDGQSVAHRKAYARGASGWLFWWTGLEPLPPWLRAAPVADGSEWL
jgi:hypothetical protein